MQEIREFAKKAEALKALVVGDIIIDKYTYCDVQGLMSKDMGYPGFLFHIPFSPGYYSLPAPYGTPPSWHYASNTGV